MAGVAGRRVTGGNMIWNRAAECLCAVPLRQMAAVTCGVRRCQRVIVVHVAVGAGLNASPGGRHDMPACQCPTCGAVVEFSVGPQQRIVTGRT